MDPLLEVFNGQIRLRDKDVHGVLSLERYKLEDLDKGQAKANVVENEGVEVTNQNEVGESAKRPLFSNTEFLYAGKGSRLRGGGQAFRRKGDFEKGAFLEVWYSRTDRDDKSADQAEYHRLKTIVEQIQNKICQVESDDCDHESAHQATETREGQLRQQQDVVETERKNLQHALEIAQLELNSLELENKDLQTKVNEGKGAASPSKLANVGVDVIPKDKEMGVVGADVVFVQQVAPASNEPMIFEETPETAHDY
ncbi:uncharacterized protein G2W53_026776 [Senna tora]|uniref:Uncharacterized protein n=1 Tax=Senna tora TaxID=362788 RepID=A0A834THY5_9FABA|nr:uncharacterized protein G2W53_026776 [Senna tora]